MKKPSVFVNKIDHKLNNNEFVFSSYNDDKKTLSFNNDKVNVRKKLNEIFSSPNYVYKANTIVKTKDGFRDLTIVGMNKDKLLTIDNETINISDILDINLKK